jgi:cell pole-organizing protein PopZ
MEEILASIRRIISEDEASAGGMAVGGASAPAIGADDVLILKDRAPAEMAPAPLPPPAAAPEAAPAASPEIEPVSEFAQFQPLPVEPPLAAPSAAHAEPDAESDAAQSFHIEPAAPPPPAPVFEAAPPPAPVEAAPPRVEPPPPVAASAPLVPPPPVSENWVVKTPEDEHPVVAQETALSAAAAFQKLSMVVDSAHVAPINMAVSTGGPTLEDITRELLRPVLKAWLDENLAGIVRERVDEEVERISRGRVR